MRAFWIFLFSLLFFFSCTTKKEHLEMDLDQEGQQSFDLAQAQLDAYNSRDIEAFMSVYSDSVNVYRFPNTLIMQGYDEMKERYASMFENSPDLHCLLVNRVVQGNTVIDQELVTRKKGEPQIQAIAIYKVAEGKIQEVYFISL